MERHNAPQAADNVFSLLRAAARATSLDPPMVFGGVSEWLKETDCKSVRYAYAGSNPASSTIGGPEFPGKTVETSLR